MAKGSWPLVVCLSMRDIVTRVRRARIDGPTLPLNQNMGPVPVDEDLSPKDSILRNDIQKTC
ncbi:predicted protein [Uncinocarpus reesii 1704]|uniref:Uncharacterized protein n=1 Tax=Uncinocarpus reesii (strain UAMH 1704) TaxID=336963 RepID=C4JL43_UNCRE|nr:uncharacterized protein UREG_00258 [Uncinocarpus reesii 1704]EEP75412.1 predicted protein [Uncinocarpus reesii 1704]